MGAGYVGLVSAAFLARSGYAVTMYDKDGAKIEQLRRGKCPIYEPGLAAWVRSTVRSGKLQATKDLREAVSKADAVFIAVGTTATRDGTPNISDILAVCKKIASIQDRRAKKLVVVRSTILPGTTESRIRPILPKERFDLLYQPEFLQEGRAVQATLKPSRIVIGESNDSSGNSLVRLYRESYGGRMPPVLRVTAATAEMIKYASNAFLAMKLSYINEIADLCEKLPRVDVAQVAEGIGLDPRIGKDFLRAGPGFGGSCLPKDLKGLIAFSNRVGCRTPMLRTVEQLNRKRISSIIDKLKNMIGKVSGKRIAILGLAFKAGTDDVRESPSIRLIQQLRKEGARIRVHDPKALRNARLLLKDGVAYFEDVANCIRGADACVIMTEWADYGLLNPSLFRGEMRNPLILDARKLLKPELFRGKAKYFQIGLRVRGRGQGS